MEGKQQIAEKAVAAYDAFVFAAIGLYVDDFAFRADMLAANAVEALESARRAAVRAGEPAWLIQQLTAQIAEFRDIAGALA